MAVLKFLRSWSNSKVKAMRAKMKVPIGRSCYNFMNIIIIHIDSLVYIWQWRKFITFSLFGNNGPVPGPKTLAQEI
jgi:hypothetical protein